MTSGSESATLAVTVTVTDVDEDPVITGESAVNYAENGEGAVATYSASDPEDATVTLTLGGTDAASFSLSDGELTFGTPPDYEDKNLVLRDANGFGRDEQRIDAEHNGNDNQRGRGAGDNWRFRGELRRERYGRSRDIQRKRP